MDEIERRLTGNFPTYRQGIGVKPGEAIVALPAIIAVLWTLMSSGEALSQNRNVDFRWSPRQYMTAICLPYDWQKTLATERGALAYDFGPGPYARPLTEIEIGLKGRDLRVVRQTLADAEVPVVRTELSGDGEGVHLSTFAIIPENPIPGNVGTPGLSVRRIGGVNGCMDWASPPATTDPAFRNVAWGTNRPIRYVAAVAPGARKLVAVGLCESYKGQPRSRLIEIRVEGSPPLTVDPMESGERNRPYAFLFNARDENNDGLLSIEAHASPMSPDPNVILNAFWIFPPDANVTADEIIRGDASKHAGILHTCGTELEDLAPYARADAMLATFDGDSVVPEIIVRSRRSLKFAASEGILLSSGSPFLLSRPRPISATMRGDRLVLELPRGTKRAEVVVVHGTQRPPGAHSVPNLSIELKRSIKYWRDDSGIRYDGIVLPDSGIQFVLDASIRNMHQVAEKIDGHLQFQPGPTVYRGLWLGDVVITGIPLMMLGDTSSARTFLETGMHCRLPGGQFRSIYPKVALIETPLAIYAMCWYAQATGNKEWLRERWSVIREGLDWVRRMREQTLSTPGAPYAGLMPPGFIDGGISTESADYGSVWWGMTALEMGISSARWLGIPSDAVVWQKLLDAFTQSFQLAARRDLWHPKSRSAYLPIAIGDTSTNAPEKGQFAFLLPFPHSRFFQRRTPLMDSILAANFAMLDGTLKEGLITNSGWMQGGIWPWLGGIHGMALDIAGNSAGAHDLLYAFANHAAPTGTWVEEQQRRDIGDRTSGDVSDAEASAIFVHFVRNLIVKERLDNLELLAGLPPEWIVPGGQIALNNNFTEFGPVSLRAALSPDGRSAELFVSALDGRGSNGKPVVSLKAFKQHGFLSADGEQLPDVINGTWGKEISMKFHKP